MSLFPRHWLPVLTLAALLIAHVTAHAQDKIEVADVFSYQLPPGWAKVDLPGSSYPSAVEAATQGGQTQAQAMITVNADTSNSNLNEWCVKSLARNKAQLASLGAQVGTLEPFATTTDGVNGYRATVDLTARGRPIHYVMYFFDGGSSTKIAITCACPATNAAHYAPLFEAAMKTYVPR